MLQVSGIFDKIVVRSIIEAIDRSEANGSAALILQLTGRGAVVSTEEMTALLQRVADAKVPIGIWVGPSRSSRAYGLQAQLMAVADVTAMVGGSRIGYISTPLTVNGAPISFGEATDQLVNGSMSFNEARAAGVLKLDTTDQGVPTVRNMVLAMDGQTIDGRLVNTVVTQLDDKGQEQNVSTVPVFSSLGLVEQVMHTVASPPMAFLLFIIGLALLIFEFFTAGVGIAGGGRRGLCRARLLRAQCAPRSTGCRGAARAVDARIRDRRAGRHSQVVDGRRDRAVHHRCLVPVHAGAGQRSAPRLDHA